MWMCSRKYKSDHWRMASWRRRGWEDNPVEKMRQRHCSSGWEIRERSLKAHGCVAMGHRDRERIRWLFSLPQSSILILKSTFNSVLELCFPELFIFSPLLLSFTMRTFQSHILRPNSDQVFIELFTRIYALCIPILYIDPILWCLYITFRPYKGLITLI